MTGWIFVLDGYPSRIVQRLVSYFKEHGIHHDRNPPPVKDSLYVNLLAKMHGKMFAVECKSYLFLGDVSEVYHFALYLGEDLGEPVTPILMYKKQKVDPHIAEFAGELGVKLIPVRKVKKSVEYFLDAVA